MRRARTTVSACRFIQTSGRLPAFRALSTEFPTPRPNLSVFGNEIPAEGIIRSKVPCPINGTFPFPNYFYEIDSGGTVRNFRNPITIKRVKSAFSSDEKRFYLIRKRYRPYQ